MNIQLDNSKNMKIILCGLDNAGKSSMLIAIQRMYKFIDEVNTLEPTIRIDYYQRNFLGFQVNFWDFGGQKKFRDRYLQRGIYFDNVDAFIYLIDIQDDKRFDESIDYLGKILDILDEVEYNKSFPVLICFSKMDMSQEFQEKNEYIIRLAQVRKQILEKFSDFKFDFFSTSIYNIYSVVKMISQGLSRKISGYQNLRDTIMNYAEENDFNQILVFDETGLIIAEYINSLKDINPDFYDETISEHLQFYKQTTDEQDSKFRYSRKVQGDLMDICFKFSLKVDAPLSENNPNYYVSIIIDKEEGRKSKWDRLEIIETLREIINSIYNH